MGKVDTKYLNPFFTSAYDVLEEMSGESVARGNLRLHKSPECKSHGFAVIIGITGQVEGRVILDMSPPTAIKFAEIMNMEEIGELDDLVKSSMGEVGNMISGRAVSKLQNLGYDFRITPPTLFEGNDMVVSTPASLPVIVVPLALPFGEILINLALTEAMPEDDDE